LLLFGALIVIFVAHFLSVLWLAHDKPNAVEEVSRVFNTWIPVFAGLFGSAATFYFTQGRKQTSRRPGFSVPGLAIDSPDFQQCD
jgi:hypothetical protein